MAPMTSMATMVQNLTMTAALVTMVPMAPMAIVIAIGITAIYPANSRSPRTRANSARIRQQFADTHTPANSAERSPEYAERSPEFGGVRSGSPEFARTPPRTGERFARKFVRGKKSRSPLTGVRRGSPRT